MKPATVLNSFFRSSHQTVEGNRATWGRFEPRTKNPRKTKFENLEF